MQLNKQIQLLETQIRNSTINVERQNSHLSASSVNVNSFYNEMPQATFRSMNGYDTPQATFRSMNGYDTPQANFNSMNGYSTPHTNFNLVNGCNTPEANFKQMNGYDTPHASGFVNIPMRLDNQLSNVDESSGYNGCNSVMGRSDFSSAPIERESFKPRVNDVNYIEGSNDMKWSSRDFPWTRKLEVNTCIHLDIHLLYGCLNCFMLKSFRLKTKRCLVTIHFDLTKGKLLMQL